MVLDSWRSGLPRSSPETTPPASVQVSLPSSSRSMSTSSFSSSEDEGVNYREAHHDFAPVRVPNPSLRQRGNNGGGSDGGDRDDNLRDDDNGVGVYGDSRGQQQSSSSLLGSVVELASSTGAVASSLMLGPHMFSSDGPPSPPPRSSLSPPLSPLDSSTHRPSLALPPSSVPYRRAAAAPQSAPPRRSPSCSVLGGSNGGGASSSSDADLECGGPGAGLSRDDMSMSPLLSAPATISDPSAPGTKKLSPLSLSLFRGRRKHPHLNNGSGNSHNSYAFVLRTREQIIIHFLMELRMLRTDLPFVFFGLCYQLFHSIVTNVAYWQHARLSAANRVPLRDMAFDVLPQVDGKWWMVSEYILYTIIAIVVSCIVSNLVVRWNAPHGRPIYCMQIVRRMLMTLVACQTLRMVSFMITTLPGASRQCRYRVPEGMTAESMLYGAAPGEGNPSGWAPPTTLYDIIFRIDATNGCGDLMFSSHTIFTMTFVCIIFKYFDFPWLKRTMVLLQLAIVPFILASRKHYSVDVFTALYVTPLVFETLWIKRPDRDTSTELARQYGIRFYLAQGGRDSFVYVVRVWGKEYYVDPDQLPVDLAERGQRLLNNLSSPSLATFGKSGEDSRAVAIV